jgi:hypothetical protein
MTQMRRHPNQRPGSADHAFAFASAGLLAVIILAVLITLLT